MRFGVYVNPQTPGPEDDGRIIDEVLGTVDLAERIGYEDVWMTEHHFTGYNAYSDPMMLAVAISQRNPSLNIGFSVAIAPLNDPVRFVTQCNILDQLSHGKLIVGFGAGNSPDEFAGFGENAKVRHAKMDEWIEFTDLMWTNQNGEGISYHGEYFNADIRGRIIPSPVQKPRPQMAWGTTTMATVERTAKLGWALLIGPQDATVVASRMKLFRETLAASGHDAETIRRALHYTGQLRQIYVAAPGEDWRDTIGSAMEIYARKSALANSGLDNLPKDDIDQRIERYLQNWLLAGTADEIYERLLPIAKCGVSHLMCWHVFGHMNVDLVRASMLRFAADVMPRLKDVAFDEAFNNDLALKAPPPPVGRPTYTVDRDDPVTAAKIP